MPTTLTFGNKNTKPAAEDAKQAKTVTAKPATPAQAVVAKAVAATVAKSTGPATVTHNSITQAVEERAVKTEPRSPEVQEVTTAQQADAVQKGLENPCKSALLNDDAPVTGEPLHRHWTASPLPVAKATPAQVPAKPAASMLSDDAIQVADISLPVLNLVQGVGELSAIFDPGSIVFNKALVLAHAPAKGPGNESDPIRILVLGFRPTRYAEQIKGGERGRIFNSEAAVFEAGGTTVWKEAFVDGEQVKDYFQALATAVILVEAPVSSADDEDTFPLSAPDNAGTVRRYGLALWHLRGTGFTNAAKPLKTARALSWLRKGYPTKFVTVRTMLKTFGSNRAFIPIVRPPRMDDPEATPSAAMAELAASVISALSGSGPESNAGAEE